MGEEIFSGVAPEERRLGGWVGLAGWGIGMVWALVPGLVVTTRFMLFPVDFDDPGNARMAEHQAFLATQGVAIRLYGGAALAVTVGLLLYVLLRGFAPRLERLLLAALALVACAAIAGCLASLATPEDDRPFRYLAVAAIPWAMVLAGMFRGLVKPYRDDVSR